MGSKLFSKLRLRDLELENRIVVSPMCQYSAVDGVMNDWHLMHLGNLSVSGPGLVFKMLRRGCLNEFPPKAFQG